MKKSLAIAAIGLVVGLQVGSAGAVQRYVCDPQKSVLCVGLVSVFQMEEDSDRSRDSVDGGIQWLEAPDTDVARAAGKVDSYGASFSGVDGTYLYIPRGGSLISNSTVAMWIYPTSAASEQIILSADEATKHGPYLSLVPAAGNVKLKATAHYGDGRGDVSVTSTGSMTLNAWHLVVWGYDSAVATDFATTSDTGRVMYVQVDSGARDSVGLAYFPIIGPFNDLVLGQRRGSGVAYTQPYSGRVDQLLLASRTWDSVDVTEFYSVGSGKAYPFAPTTYASLNDGLLAYFKMDEATNATRNDSVNQNNAADATSGIAQSSTAKIGYSAYRDTNGERLAVTSNSQVEYGGDFTVAGWYRADSLAGATQLITMKSNWSTGFGEWYIYTNTTSLRFWVADSTGGISGPPANSCNVTSGPTLSTATWYFIVADYTASTKTCRISINASGTWYSATGVTVPAVQTGVPMTFAGDAGTGGNGSNGFFDEWGSWRRVLTSTEHTNLYNGGNGRTYPF